MRENSNNQKAYTLDIESFGRLMGGKNSPSHGSKLVHVRGVGGIL